jgi:hypothetical protein
MARSNRVTVPIRDRKRQRLDVYAPPALRATGRIRPLPEARPAPRRTPHYGEIFAGFEHLGVALLTRPRPTAIDPVGDVENVWATQSYPASAFPTHAEALAFSSLMRARATNETPVEYAHSRRRLPGQGMPLGANEITSGYNLVLALRRRAEAGESGRIEDLYGIQHNSAWVDRQRSAEEVLDDWDALEPLFTDDEDPGVHLRWETKRRELALRLLERFDPFSRRVAQTDLTFRVACALAGDLDAVEVPARPAPASDHLRLYGRLCRGDSLHLARLRRRADPWHLQRPPAARLGLCRRRGRRPQ